MNHELIKDIPIQIEIEIGSTRMLIDDILKLSQGSLIELDQLANEPVKILANGIAIGTGQIVVIDNSNYGVKILSLNKTNFK